MENSPFVRHVIDDSSSNSCGDPWFDFSVRETIHLVKVDTEKALGHSNGISDM